jgi:F0F1-type ATP synthase assembly protein I
LANEPYVAHEQGPPESPFAGLATYLEQRMRQLWQWLGAEDIPADPPYGGSPPDQHLRDQQEQARLQQLRHELQAELRQQRQEATTREAARTQELAQLRQQLAQAGQSATARQAEQQATAKLEGELRTTRAELAARNHELDARIQQLGLLIRQLQANDKPTQPLAATPPAPISQPVPARPLGPLPASRPAARPRPASFRRLRQAERWGVVALVLAGLGAGTWGVVRLAHPPKPRAATKAVPRTRPSSQQEEETTPNVVYVVDSTLAPTQAESGDAALYSVDKAAAPTEVTAPAKQLADSAATPAVVGPPPTAAPDSAATPSPTP